MRKATSFGVRRMEDARRQRGFGRQWSAWGRALRLGAVGLLLLLGCGRPLDAQECALLLDRYTEKLIRNERPQASIQFIHDKQREARELAKRDAQYEFEACPSKVSRRQYQCAMQAPDVDEMERCLTL